MNPRHDFVQRVSAVALEAMSSNPDCVNGLHLSIGSEGMGIDFCWSADGRMCLTSLYVFETEFALMSHPELVLRVRCNHKVEELRRDKNQNL